jgi:hypothetical protein
MVARRGCDSEVRTHGGRRDELVARHGDSETFAPGSRKGRDEMRRLRWPRWGYTGESRRIVALGWLGALPCSEKAEGHHARQGVGERRKLSSKGEGRQGPRTMVHVGLRKRNRARRRLRRARRAAGARRHGGMG